MNVIFYDINQKLALGLASQIPTLSELLGKSDFVSLHVPETDETKMMIKKAELANMKQGSFLINASRGSVVPHIFNKGKH